MNFSQEEIDRIKAENSPLDVAIKYGLEPKRQGSDHVAPCPFHNDKTPSFVINDDHYHCYGCGWHGDQIAFVQAIEDIDFKSACERLGAQKSETQTPESAEKRRQRLLERRKAMEEREEEERRKKVTQRLKWPLMCLGKEGDLQELGDSREPRISYAGVWLAQQAGYLRFCLYPPATVTTEGRVLPLANTEEHHLCWVIGDRVCVQIRRLDGGKLLVRGERKKSKNLIGSSVHPIGLTKGNKPVIICEGGPDYLAVWHYLSKQGLQDDREPVCMLGTSVSLGEYASWLRGRDVLIIPHKDDDPAKGEAAGKRWAEEAHHAGALSVGVMHLLTKDLNDSITS